jgi:membrane glycosyltransferase
MDTGMTGPPAQGDAVPAPVAARDASDPALLAVAEQPLAMPPQDFAEIVPITREAKRRGYWVPRAAVFFGAALLTTAFAYELYGVLSVVQVTPLQLGFLVLSTISFGWIALGTLSCAMGFLPLFAGEKADSVRLAKTITTPAHRTALLFPVHHEDPASIAGTITAIAEELEAIGQAKAFDIFILSDTRGEAAGTAEEAAYRDLVERLKDRLAVYYRRRIEATARKAGNIKDWVERFGGAYEQFIILDADSVMSGDALVKLALAMDADPNAGLIQTVPRIVGGSTLLQKLQQFACNVYGPSVAAGLAFWHRDQGNYWGHNAVIRTRAFATAAGLPDLPGEKPFGGHIMSHDFVEAVLLQRAGWGVHMVPSVAGSFEGVPPSLADLVVRDRRWAQGNLQHLKIVAKRGLTTMGRVHLAMGAFSYLVSAIWALSLIVGIVLTLQSQQLFPSYFQDSKTLFPIWPVIDPGAAMRLFLATMAVVLLPKWLGMVLEIKRAYHAGELFGTPRAIVGVIIETLFSMLLAPILMMTQTAAIVQIWLGHDSGWKAQSRGGDAIALKDALRSHWLHSALGILVAFICWETSPGLLVWMSPVILGLVLSGFVHWLTAQPAGPVFAALLSTDEERQPAPILQRADRHTDIWSKRIAANTTDRNLANAA